MTVDEDAPTFPYRAHVTPRVAFIPPNHLETSDHEEDFLMKFTDELREATRDSWEQSVNHPFIKGIANGDLPQETCKNYNLQDMYYLKHYANAHAHAAAHTDDFTLTAMLAEKARSTTEAELEIHEEHAEIAHITDEQMKNYQPAPTAYSYTSHLHRATRTG